MSAFAVVYERSNTPLEPGVLERAMARLKFRGPDGHNTQIMSHAAMGHWHFWTTPEEVGEKQPFQLAGKPFTVVLDGRLDNRPDLLIGLNINPLEGNHLSDAALVLYAYERWGEQCFEHFIGEYALVILDEHQNKLLCARDSLGDRTMFYSFKGTRLVIASEPWAVARADESSPELNDIAVVSYFSTKTPEDGQTLFKNIYELLPAQAMEISGLSQRQWLTWQPDPTTKVRRNSDEQYGEEFRSLLEESIRCRLRSNTPVGVLMSGGLDSCSVACMAAKMLAPQPLTTISYVFDELTDCDERKYIEAVKAQWGIRSIQILCDDAWPYKNWQTWPLNPNLPEGNPYRLLSERAYHRANDEGLRVLLTGGFGDQLYSAGRNWLVDLAVEGKLAKAGFELNRQIRSAGLRWTLQAGFLQSAARRLLNLIPGGKHLHRRASKPDWLTEYSISLLTKDQVELDPFYEQHSNLLGIRTATSSSGEIRNASRHNIELRHPYRDQRLVEFVLALPAYQLYFHRYKHVLRTAMKGILPESIRTRIYPTSKEQLFFRGQDRERNVLQSFLKDQKAGWRKFVRADWLKSHWDPSGKSRQDIIDVMVPWLCFSYGTWYQNYCSNRISGD